jgi:hypothetical protein
MEKEAILAEGLSIGLVFKETNRTYLHIVWIIAKGVVKVK